MASFARILGLVHRHVRRTQQLFGPLLGTDSDADPCGREQPVFPKVRGARSRARKRSATSPSTATNSSPPSRAAASASRKHPFERSATPRGTRSPLGWPKEMSCPLATVIPAC